MMIDRIKSGRARITFGGERPAATLATTAWLAARGLRTTGAPWTVAIALDTADRPASHEFDADTDTRFHILLGRDEWGFYFCHGGRASWIRITDVPSVFERDDHALLSGIPPLRDLGSLVQRLEEQHRIRFHRKHAAIRSSLPDSEHAIRIWVAAAI